MKKRIAIVATACLLLFTTACGSKIPDGMSEKTYNAAIEALKAEESYLNGKLTADEVYDKISSIYDLLNTFEFEDDDEQFNNDLITYDLSIFNFGLLAGSDVTDSYENLKDIFE